MHRQSPSLLLLLLASALLTSLAVGCQPPPSDESAIEGGETTADARSTPVVTASFDVSPSVITKGLGLDLESGVSYDLNLAPAGWAYDLRLQTIKGRKGDGTSAGAPHIKLYKQVVKGYQSERLGTAALAALRLADVEEARLAADAVEEIAMAEVRTGSDNDYDKLVAYYQANLVTRAASNWLPSPWGLGTDERLFIVRTEEGGTFAFQILGMGPATGGSGSKPGGGLIELSYVRLH